MVDNAVHQSSHTLAKRSAVKTKAVLQTFRVSKAIGKFNEMRQVLTDQKVNMTTRNKLMGACVRSRLLYGTQV